MASPSKYSDHPLYCSRIGLLISAAIGVFLAMVSIPTAYYGDVSGPFAMELVLLFLSGLLCTFDLMIYKIVKATEPDHEPKWPLRKYMYGDLAFALLLQWMFWLVVTTLELDRYRAGYGSNTLLHAYATLPVLASSILHGSSFWKELMARKKAAWLFTQPLLPCTICGARPNTDAKGNTLQTQALYADGIEDLRARFYQSTHDDTSDESEVLIKDFDSSYGAIEPERTPATLSTKSKKSKGKGAQV